VDGWHGLVFDTGDFERLMHCVRVDFFERRVDCYNDSLCVVRRFLQS
jgi:hypothetical protein